MLESKSMRSVLRLSLRGEGKNGCVAICARVVNLLRNAFNTYSTKRFSVLLSFKVQPEDGFEVVKKECTFAHIKVK